MTTPITPAPITYYVPNTLMATAHILPYYVPSQFVPVIAQWHGCYNLTVTEGETDALRI